MKFFLFISSLLLSACSSNVGTVLSNEIYAQDKYEAHSGIIETVKLNEDIRIDYKSNEYLQMEHSKEDSLRRAKTTSELISFYKGGIVIVNVSDITIDAASPQYWEIIVEDMNGREIVRKQGSRGTPYYTTKDGYVKWNSAIVVGLREPIIKKFKVFVYHRIGKTQSEFIVNAS